VAEEGAPGSAPPPENRAGTAETGAGTAG